VIAIHKKLNGSRYQINAHPVKVTALEYIRETVKEERYEELSEIVGIAREFGADEREISIALTENFTRAGGD
jgi:hypothetical protein